MIKKLVDEEPLQRFAREASSIPESRGREIEAQLPWTSDDKHDTGIFVGLAVASEHLAHESSEGSRLREVAAARVLWQRLVMLSQPAEPGTPEFMAGTEAHIEGLKTGRIKSIPAEELHREMEEWVKELQPNVPVARRE